MAVTPRSETIVHTPSTPRHGAAYDASHTRVTRRSVIKSQQPRQTPPTISDPTTPKSRASYSKVTQRRQTISRQPLRNEKAPSSQTQKVTQSGHKMDIDGPAEAGLKTYTTLPGPEKPLPPHMLPTPVKTPRKKLHPESKIGGGRILFPDRDEDPMPGVRKHGKGKRHVGFSLHGDLEDEDTLRGNDVPIYTDSRDRVPVLDLSEDNPFLEHPRGAQVAKDPSTTRTLRKRKAAFGLDGSKEIEDAFNREEGMVYVFRGKKIYRRFPKEDAEREDDSNQQPNTVDGDTFANQPGDLEGANPQPLRRSDIKPRLLFPSPAQRKTRSAKDAEDEEAPTDIDESTVPADEQVEKLTRTPKKNSFIPNTPPDTTARTTRSKDALSFASAAHFGIDNHPAAASPGTEAGETTVSETEQDSGHESNVPAPHRQGKKISPFNGWLRTKPSFGPGSKSSATAAKSGRKRSATVYESDDVMLDEPTMTMAGSKKTRSEPGYAG